MLPFVENAAHVDQSDASKMDEWATCQTRDQSCSHRYSLLLWDYTALLPMGPSTHSPVKRWLWFGRTRTQFTLHSYKRIAYRHTFTEHFHSQNRYADPHTPGSTSLPVLANRLRGAAQTVRVRVPVSHLHGIPSLLEQLSHRHTRVDILACTYLARTARTFATQNLRN